MQTVGNRGGALLQARQRLGGQILLGATHGLGRHLIGERGHDEPIGLQHTGELQHRIRGLAGQNQRLAAAPARGPVLRLLLADRVGTGFDLHALHLAGAVERGRHAAVDRRLDGQGVRPRLLDPQLDAQQVAHDLLLGGLGEVQHHRLPIRRLRQRRR